MADAVGAIIGIVLMVGFISAIAGKLGDIPLWIVSLIAIAMMLWAFWQDAFAPLFRRTRRD